MIRFVLLRYKIEIYDSDMYYNDAMSHRLDLIILYIVLNLAMLAPLQAENFPNFVAEENTTDVSGKLSAEYLMRIEEQLQSYPFVARVVYLPNTRNTNLGRYAAELFDHWHLTPDSMLVVVALDRRKIGIHAGPALKDKLKAQNQEQMDQEIPLPEASPSASASVDPENPNPEPTDELLDLSQGLNHLELVSQAIEEVSTGLQMSSNIKTPPNKQSPQPQKSAPLSQDNGSDGPPSDPGKDIEPFQLTTILSLIGVSLVAIASWFGFVFWRRRHATHSLINKYSLQGQVVYGQLESIYESIEALMPDFHGYLGDTEKTLTLFLKSMSALQNEYEAIFDAFDAEVKHLSEKDSREDAIEFFQNLERKQEEGKQLYEQALHVLRNLKNARQTNQQLFEQSDVRRQAFSQEISETRKLHPGLKLLKIQQAYQQALADLQKLEKQNERDPLGVEKKLQDWRKRLNKMETETRSLPHLYQQFTGDLKQRILNLRERIQSKGQSVQHRQALAEIDKLHQTLIHAIEQGDLQSLDRYNESFTRKLQHLEAEV